MWCPPQKAVSLTRLFMLTTVSLMMMGVLMSMTIATDEFWWFCELLQKKCPKCFWERFELLLIFCVPIYIVNKSQNPLSVLLPWNHQRSLSLFIFLKFQFYEKWQMILFFKGKCVKYQGQMCHISMANVSKSSRANVLMASDTQSGQSICNI